MAVYTSISRGVLEPFLTRYDVGGLEHFEGIRGGVANTNYYVDTRDGAFVLTLFETLEAAELPFFLDLMAHLSAHGVPCAAPVTDRQGRLLAALAGRPAALFGRLQGREATRAGDGQLRAVGIAMARLHRVGKTFPGTRDDEFGGAWQQATVRRIRSRLDARNRALLVEEFEHAAGAPGAGLPGGMIHGDLFRDNVLFVGEAVSGILDFYFACHAVWMLDVAIALNDWCSAPDGRLDVRRARLLLDGYGETRSPAPAERQALPALMRVAAFRFWLSRLHDQHFPRAAAVAHIKNPVEFRRILIDRRECEGRYAKVWS